MSDPCLNRPRWVRPWYHRLAWTNSTGSTGGNKKAPAVLTQGDRNAAVQLKNERVELEMRIMRFRQQLSRATDEQSIKRAEEEIAKLTQKLREMDNWDGATSAGGALQTSPTLSQINIIRRRWPTLLAASTERLRALLRSLPEARITSAPVRASPSFWSERIPSDQTSGDESRAKLAGRPWRQFTVPADTVRFVPEMKLMSEYLERAINLERLAAGEADSGFKRQLLEQAAAYRNLAAKRAKELGLPAPSLPEPPKGDAASS
jgi:hypothetical protein